MVQIDRAMPLKRVTEKNDYYRALVNWTDKWCEFPYFTLTELTGKAMSFTFRSQAMLIPELLDEGFKFILTTRLQSDALEPRFSRYCQMSGGRFLVSLTCGKYKMPKEYWHVDFS